MIVKHNITAMNSNRMLGLTTSSQAKSTEKLSSGYKINKAADDAAGLSISEKMRRQVRGLTQAAANAQDGISVVQTAEGALNEVEDMLQRMNELAVKGENGTLTTTERSSLQAEIKQLMSEVDRVQSTTTFNEMNLLDGAFIKGLQVGAEAGQHIEISIQNMSMAGLAKKADKLYDPVKYNKLEDATANYNKTEYAETTETYEASPKPVIGTVSSGSTSSYKPALTKTEVDPDVCKSIYEKAMNLEAGDVDSVFTQQDFNSLNAFVKAAITLVSMQRSDLGAIQNRLEHTINNLNNITENTQSAEAAIRDTDIATEMVTFSNNNILQQAGTSMLSQANQSNQLALSLLG
ncbi:MAG: flagellin [Bacteroidales bacterium]|nr:flagellin [Bacteroidales bacterium]MCM1416507.1 flagellin [bacterium]MCM1422678.1 flagellin [bacterium]